MDYMTMDESLHWASVSLYVKEDNRVSYSICLLWTLIKILSILKTTLGPYCLLGEEWRMSLTRDPGEELVKSMEGSGLCLVVGLVVRIKWFVISTKCLREDLARNKHNSSILLHYMCYSSTYNNNNQSEIELGKICYSNNSIKTKITKIPKNKFNKKCTYE